MIFIHPIHCIIDIKLAYFKGVIAIKVNSLSPFSRILCCKIIAGESSNVIAIRAEMIVNNIQNHSYPKRMSIVDEMAQIIGLTIEVVRGKEVDTVITPTKLTRKLRDWHHFND